MKEFVWRFGWAIFGATFWILFSAPAHGRTNAAFDSALIMLHVLFAVWLICELLMASKLAARCSAVDYSHKPRENLRILRKANPYLRGVFYVIACLIVVAGLMTVEQARRNSQWDGCLSVLMLVLLVYLLARVSLERVERVLRRPRFLTLLIGAYIPAFCLFLLMFLSTDRRERNEWAVAMLMVLGLYAVTRKFYRRKSQADSLSQLQVGRELRDDLRRTLRHSAPEAIASAKARFSTLRRQLRDPKGSGFSAEYVGARAVLQHNIDLCEMALRAADDPNEGAIQDLKERLDWLDEYYECFGT